jgi:uncharacterized membrane protein
VKGVVWNREELLTTAGFVAAWIVGCAIGIIGGIWWFS